MIQFVQLDFWRGLWKNRSRIDEFKSVFGTFFFVSTNRTDAPRLRHGPADPRQSNYLQKLRVDMYFQIYHLTIKNTMNDYASDTV